MTRKKPLFKIMISAIALLVVLESCKPSVGHNRDTNVRITQQEGFPKSLRISISSNSLEPVCVSGAEINNAYLNLKITQNGARIFSATSSNVAIRDYKSINAVEPIYIILNGSTDFWYELDDFPLQRGPFRVEARIRMVVCSDLFGQDNPRWFAVTSTNTFNYDPDDG